jgi:hypothetical protein
MKLRRFLKPDLDLLNAFRRYIEERIDQVFAILWKKLGLGYSKAVETFDGEPRFALITVNFSTTYYLKLMLLTLCEQDKLKYISRIIIVDNNSHDGGISFLQRLVATIERVHLVENHFICTHARGLRKGVACLDKVEASEELHKKSNILLICDTDIIFRNKETLTDLASTFMDKNSAFAGELRYNLYHYPEAQTSFLAVRRDSYARSDVAPFVHHGAPAYWMQRSLWRAGLHLTDFPSNHGHYILHRGRSGVAAAHLYYPLSAFSTTPNKDPHYMGVSNGEKIWKKTEAHFSHWLFAEEEDKLIEYLSEKMKILGGGVSKVALLEHE